MTLKSKKDQMGTRDIYIISMPMGTLMHYLNYLRTSVLIISKLRVAITIRFNVLLEQDHHYFMNKIILLS